VDALALRLKIGTATARGPHGTRAAVQAPRGRQDNKARAVHGQG
jgi:hypothetical protein